MLWKTLSNTTISVLVLICGFCLLFGSFSVYQHDHFYTAAYDLGIFDQVIWKVSHFSAPFSTLRNMNLIGDHFSPILFLLAPLYWIWENPKILLWLQAISGAFSVLPLLLIAHSTLQIKSPFKQALYPLLTCVYFLFVGYQNSLGFDFHPETMMLFPLSLFFYALHFERKKLYWGLFFLLLLTKEEFSLLLFFVGLYAFLVRKWFRHGGLTMIISLLYFGLVCFWWMPYLNGGLIAGGYMDYHNLGDTPLEVITTSITNPSRVLAELTNPSLKITTFLILTSSFLFLPLLSAFSFLLSLPIFLARFLSVSPLRWGLDFHYWVVLAPTFFVGSIYSMKRLVSKPHLLSVLIVFMFLINMSITIQLNSFLSRFIKNYRPEGDYARMELLSAIAQIPPEVSVSAQSPLVPHLSQRDKIYMYPEEKTSADFVVVSLERATYPFLFNEMEAEIDHLKKDPHLRLFRQQGNTYIFKRD